MINVKISPRIWFLFRDISRRQGQYTSVTIPRIVLVAPALIMILAVLAWYATSCHYQFAGRIMTVFTTLITVLATLNLSHWSTHRSTPGKRLLPNPERGSPLIS
jgi:hypothetical protein